MSRFLRALLAALLLSMGAVHAALGQAAPSAADLPRLNVLLETLVGMPAAQAQTYIQRLSSKDIDGLLWLMKNRPAARAYGQSQPDAIGSVAAPTFEGPRPR